jgi:hypothetical protein
VTTPKYDPQRDKLYYLEAEINGSWGIDTGSRSKLLTALGKMSRYYNVPEPKLILTRNMTEVDAGWWDEDAGSIVLHKGRSGANLHILIHEFSHLVTDYYYDDAEPHGKEFAAVYMHLLDKYHILPHKCFRMLARKYRLKIGRRFRPDAIK